MNEKQWNYYLEHGELYNPKNATTIEEKREYWDVDDMDISVRLFRMLNKSGIRTIDQLLAMPHDDLWKIFKGSSRRWKELNNLLLIEGFTTFDDGTPIGETQ